MGQLLLNNNISLTFYKICHLTPLAYIKFHNQNLLTHVMELVHFSYSAR